MDSVILCSYPWECALFLKCAIFHKNKIKHKNTTCAWAQVGVFECRGMLEGLEMTCTMQPKPWAGNTAEAFWTQGFPLAMFWGSWEDLTFPFIIGHETMYDFRAEGMGFWLSVIMPPSPLIGITPFPQRPFIGDQLLSLVLRALVSPNFQGLSPCLVMWHGGRSLTKGEWSQKSYRVEGTNSVSNDC